MTILHFKVSLDNLGPPGKRKPTEDSDHLSKFYEIKGAGGQELKKKKKTRKKDTRRRKKKQSESMNCLIGTRSMNHVVA